MRKRLVEFAWKAWAKVAIVGFFVLMAGLTVVMVLGITGVIHSAPDKNPPPIQSSDVDYASNR